MLTRVSGADPERLVISGEAALDAGFELGSAPSLSPRRGRAGRLSRPLRPASRRASPTLRVTLVLGCELSLFCSANLPGDHHWDRPPPRPHHHGRHPSSTPSPVFRQPSTASLPVRSKQRETISAARSPTPTEVGNRSTGRPSTSSPTASIETVTTQPATETNFASLVHGKPVAITEFGCCTYRRAADRGGHVIATSLRSLTSGDGLDCGGEIEGERPVIDLRDTGSRFVVEWSERAAPPSDRRD